MKEYIQYLIVQLMGTYEQSSAPVYVLAEDAGALCNDNQKDWNDSQPSWSIFRYSDLH